MRRGQSMETLDNLAAAFKGDVSAAALEKWLSQFDAEDVPYITPLVKAFKYYTVTDVFSLLERLSQRLHQELHIDPAKTWFIPSGYVAKSGDAIAYFFKRQNRVPDEAFLRGADLTEQRLSERSTVVFLDDFVGSGQLLLRTADEIAVPLRRAVPHARFIFAALVGYIRGLARIPSGGPIESCVAESIGLELEPFGAGSRLFPDSETRRKAEAVVRRYTERLSPKSPLGYGASQGLVAFFFGTPNNTLPFFWRSGSDWTPLLPHGDALHDPRRVIEIPVGTSTLIGGSKLENSTIEELDLSKEATAALFDGFQTLRNMDLAGRLMKRVSLTDAAIRSLVDAIQLLQDDIHEKKSVCTALLCAGRGQLAHLLKNAFLKFDPPISVTNTQLFRTAAQLVDGLEGALLVDETAEVSGAIIYPDAAKTIDAFLPPRYGPVAKATRDAGGFTILFLGAGRITIFDGGSRVLSRRFGKWHPQGIPTRLRSIEAEHGLSPGLLDHTMRAAFALADNGFGAILTLGDASHVVALAGKTPPAPFRWCNVSVEMPEILPLVFSARQDGATVLEQDGVLRTAMTILQPPAGALAEDEAGKGARHTTAAKVSAVTAALAVAISEDGTITLYSKGKRILRVMG